MYDAFGVLFLRFVQPAHPGSGDSTAAFDLSIQRESRTGYPMIQSSGLKGALREVTRARHLLDDDMLSLIFGRAGSEAGAAAAIGIGDARIFFFPVVSARSVFGWVTSPNALAEFASAIAVESLELSEIPEIRSALHQLMNVKLEGPQGLQALSPSDSPLKLSNEKIQLQDWVFSTFESPEQETLQETLDDLLNTLGAYLFRDPGSDTYWRERFAKCSVLIPDEAFANLVRHATQVDTRIKIGDDGTVEEGPWDVEYLPAMTLMYSLIGFQSIVVHAGNGKSNGGVAASSLLNTFVTHVTNTLPYLQIGADATLGKGIADLNFVPLSDFRLKETAPDEGSESDA